MVNRLTWPICCLVWVASVMLASGVSVYDDDVLITHAQYDITQMKNCLEILQKAPSAAPIMSLENLDKMLSNVYHRAVSENTVEVIESFASNFLARHSWKSEEWSCVLAALDCFRKSLSLKDKEKILEEAESDSFLSLNLEDGDPYLGCTYSRFINSSVVSHDPILFSTKPQPGLLFWFLEIFSFLSFTFILALLVYHSFLLPEIEDRSLKPSDSPTGSNQSSDPDIKEEVSEMTDQLCNINGDVLLELDGPLSQGRRNKVYRGTHQHRAVVVKVGLKTGSSTEAHREPDEVKYLRILRHPQVVELILSGSNMPSQIHSTRNDSKETMPDAELSFETIIVMEYCDRGSLYDVMKRGTAPIAQCFSHVTSCALEIAQGMTHIHSKRVIHGALLAQHIFLQSNARHPRGFAYKIGGFGSSVRLPRGSSTVRSDQVRNVTIASPEMLMSGTMSYASDVYAFGMLLYTLCLRRPPFRRMSCSDIQKLILARQRPVIPATIPVHLSRLIELCWSQNASERPTFSAIAQYLSKSAIPTTNVQERLLPCNAPYRCTPISEETSDQEHYKNLVPGKRYASINFRPSAESKRSTSYDHAAFQEKRRYCSRRTKSCITSFEPDVGGQGVNHEAFVRQVDALLKRSRKSESKAELREFLNRLERR